jgi:hypothetical protein
MEKYEFHGSYLTVALEAWSSYILKSMVLGSTMQNFVAPSNLVFFFLLRKKMYVTFSLLSKEAIFSFYLTLCAKGWPLLQSLKAL